MKIKKLLPILVLALLLAWYLLPDTDGAALPTTTVQATASSGLSLVTPGPTKAPKPAKTPAPEKTPAPAASASPEAGTLDEDGKYTSKEDVALYIHTYGRLPSNFVTKKEAEAAGWTGGPLDRVLPGMCIGGNRFGNYEGLLPEAKGRKWTECDINTLGAKSRGSERIVFSNDGLIYYTSDHYESFELLYDDTAP